MVVGTGVRLLGKPLGLSFTLLAGLLTRTRTNLSEKSLHHLLLAVHHITERSNFIANPVHLLLPGEGL